MLASVVVSIGLQIVATMAVVDDAPAVADGSSVSGPGAAAVSILLVFWGLGTIIPSLALLARRLHDANFSAWYMLLGVIPYFGAIVLLIMAIRPRAAGSDAGAQVRRASYLQYAAGALARSASDRHSPDLAGGPGSPMRPPG